MDRSKLIKYGVIPVCVVGVMVVMYFSGVVPLQMIIMPEIEGMYGSSMREFGLLENLQNVVLLVMVGICLMGMRVQPGALWKVALTGLTCFTLLVFLEEIDYGLHFYEYFKGVKSGEAAQERNLHNVGKRTNTIKQIVDLGMMIFFVVLPYVFRKSENRWIRQFVPDRYSVVTLLCAVVVSKTAHFLNDQGMSLNGMDNNNTSEFRELFTYYLCMLYYIEVILKRKWGGAGEESTGSDEALTESA